MVLMAVPCAAQLVVGDKLEMRVNGQVSSGYSGSYGSQGSSNHALNFGGNGNVNGFYYSPTLVTFNLLPYYNQSRDNSSYQSLSDSSGIIGTANFIKDSRFPGSISYNKSYNSNGTLGLVGLPNFTTHGNSQGFGASWSELIPGLPSLTATLTSGGGDSTVYGTSAQNTMHMRSYGLRSSYKLAGFPLSATYTHSVSQFKTPQVFSSQQETESNSSSDVYGMALSHRLPLRGAFSTNVSRSNFSTDSVGASGYTDQTDFQSATASFRPTLKSSLLASENYSDNLAGSINQSIIAAGGVPQLYSGGGTHNLNLSGGAGYSILQGLAVTALVTHVEQAYAGTDYKATYFTANANGGYGRDLFGMLHWSVSVVDNATQAGNSAVGVLANVDISRKVKGWNLSNSFDYGDNVQTQLVLYTNSFYRYSAQASRPFGRRLSWSGQGSLSHSALNGRGDGTSNDQNFSSTFSVYSFGISGTYSKMSGVSILTTNGLQSSPVPTPILPTSQLVIYGGSSYGYSISATPLQNLSLSASYTNAVSNTMNNATGSSNRSDMLSSYLQYRLRKLGLRAGYSRFMQGISAASNKPADVTTFYFGIYRSINLY
jgi:hypothetical protein